MMVGGGRSIDGNRSHKAEWERAVAEVVGGVGSSHVPAVGVGDRQGARVVSRTGRRSSPSSRRCAPWIAALRPDVCVVVYNDHANAFSLEIIPTFAIGLAPSFPPADEGFGPRPVPVVQGHPELAWHLAETLILDEFDLTLVNEMPVDHGLTVPLSLMFGELDGVAVPGRPAMRQCRSVPAADRASLLHAGPGDPARGRVVPWRRAGGRCRHRRALAPAAGRAGRSGQSPSSTSASSTCWSSDPEAAAASHTSSTSARPARRASRW